MIKRPLEHLRTDAKAAASLRREAIIGTRLRHPNLVGVLDAGVHDGYDYLVLEYVHGGSLRMLMQADTPARVHDCATNVAIAVVGDVARALHEAHELVDESGHPLGLVHRDVSPGNILIGLDGAVKLADFGIAKETRVQTLSGSMHGTVTYMAPEQCRGHAFDRRADVFSLGVILYELVTGVRLFWADNDVASLHRVLSGNVPRPRKLRPSISPTLEDIVMTAVAHEQDKRFTTARDLADALEIYAAEVGEVLGSRWIARWVQGILGPREVPWIGAPTAVDIPAVGEPRAPSVDGSLVELIEALAREAADEPPPNPTFGPTSPSFSDEIDTKPDRRPMRSGKRLAAVIAIGLVGGAGMTAFVMTRDNTPAAKPVAPGPTVETPAKIETPTTIVDPVVARPEEPVADQPVADEPVADTEIEITPDPVRTNKRRTDKRGTKKADKADKAKGSAAVVVESTSAPPPPPPEGSGSARKKAEWDPWLVLPTDSGSGTKKK